MGHKRYELTNHLGNVMATITDRRLQAGTSGDTVVTKFDPEVVNAQDYNSFGSIMEGRQLSTADSALYRYGFNGKENDNDVGKGNGGEQDYGERIYDPRLGRFLSIDPITDKYPELTPYQFASNRPIDGLDQDGLEYASAMGKVFGDNARKGQDPLGALKASAKTTYATIGNIIYSAFATALSPFEFVSDHNSGGNLSHNSQAYKDLQVKGKQDAKAFATNVALGYAGGEVFGLAGKSLGAGATPILEGFESGGTKLLSSEMLNAYPNSTTFGSPVNPFIAPTDEVNSLLSQGLSRKVIAERLGITDSKFLKGDLIRIDISPNGLRNLGLKSPTGTEAGANSLFVPGGKTVGGVTEGVVNSIPKDAPGVTSSIIETN